MGAESVDREALKRRYTPAVLDDIDQHPHNVGAKEVRELVRLARWSIADGEGLWVCGAGHVIRIGADTPPYDAGTCPICAALERAAALEVALRDTDAQLWGWTKGNGGPDPEWRPFSVREQRRVNDLLLVPADGAALTAAPTPVEEPLPMTQSHRDALEAATDEDWSGYPVRAALAASRSSHHDPVRDADGFAVAESSRDLAEKPRATVLARRILRADGYGESALAWHWAVELARVVTEATPPTEEGE